MPRNRQVQDAELRVLFDAVSVSVRVEDFSQIKTLVDRLGIDDPDRFSDYLDQNPEFVDSAAKCIRVIDANEAALSLHGFEDKSEFIDTVTRSFSSENLNAVRRGLEIVHAGETQLEFETTITRCDGSIRQVISRWTVPEASKPTYARTLLCSIDVTELRQTEQMLRQAQKMEAIGKIAGGVAHDFNNLLAVIQSCAEMLESAPGHDAKLVGNILHATGQGARLTQRLLAYARKQQLNARPVSLSTLVGGMAGLLERSLGETIEVALVTRPALWPALADPGQVEDALLNLAINARDAMPNGGKLSIECSNAHLDEAYVANHPDSAVGDYVELSITDNGTGMAPDVIQRAFEPFYTTKGVGEGSGLGLSTVYGFAIQSGGHVSIYSEVGSGTSVKLYLPRAHAHKTGTEVSLESSAPGGQGEAVLVIEDDALVREFAVRLLEDLGYEAMDVGDALEARRLLEGGSRFDLILTDVILPGGLSGPVFAGEVTSSYPETKIILMSGYPSDSARQNGFIGSENVLLNKPFRRDQLAWALYRALN